MATEKNEIDRLKLFYGQRSFEQDIAYGRHYIKTDLSMTVTIHKVDYVKTKSNNLYGETKAKDKRFLTPVVINAIINIGGSENKRLGKNGILREEAGEVVIGVYKKELEENDLQIHAGDFVSYNPDGNKIRYFEITNPNYVDYNTAQTVGGIESVYRRLVATPVREEVILKFN